MNGMIEQVKSLPALVEESFQPIDESVRDVFDHELCLSLKRLFVTGCGDSHHAALGCELAVESIAGVPCEPMTALQFARYAAGFIPQSGPKTNVVVGISVSGSVVRTAEALGMAKQAGATTVALTATPGSLVHRSAERAVLAPAPIPDPPGQHIPGVRTYTANQLALLLIAVRIGEVRGRLTNSEAGRLRSEIKGLSKAMTETVEANLEAARVLAEEWKDANDFVFVGSGPNFGSALFSAAKILEASGDPAIGQDTEEWAHLQYFARARGVPTFFITAGDRDLSRLVEAAVAAKAVGKRVVAVCPKSAEALVKVADRCLPLAEVPEMYSPLVACIPGELFSAYRADVIGEPFFRDFTGGRMSDGNDGISRIRTSQMWESWK